MLRSTIDAPALRTASNNDAPSPRVRRTCILAVAAACQTAPTLRVDVTHPSGLAIATTTVSVYESATFGCVDVEYGNVDDTQLAAALVASETIAAGGAITGNLDGLSRTDKKIVVARGYDVSGANVSAGCAEKLVVAGHDELAIATEVTATASVGIADPTGMDFYGIAVTTTDPSGALLDGRQVWWRVYGPAGATPATTANVNVVGDGTWEPTQPSCSARGIGVVHPVPPVLVGGFAIAVRVAWASAPPQLFSAFTKADFSLAPLAPPNGSLDYCATQIESGTAHVACLDANAPGARLMSAAVANGAVTLTTTTTQPTPTDAIAVYAAPNGSNQDVFVMTARCAVSGLFGSTPADPSEACPSGGADAVLYAPACGSAPARVLVHIPGGASRDVVVQVAPQGGALSPVDFPLDYRAAETSVQLVGAGCVGELDPAGGPPTLRQVIALTYAHLADSNPSTRIAYTCGGTCTPIELPVPGAGVGFIGGGEPRMIAATIGASGVALSQLVLVPGATTDQLVERTRVPSAGVPNAIGVGNFDSDPTADTLWDITSRRGTTFEVAYARLIEGQPLEALSQSQPLALDSLTVGDITNDGFDDISITGLDNMGRKGIAVIPTRVPAAIVSPKTDTTCMP